MLLQELLETFHLEAVVNIWVRIKSRLHNSRVSPASCNGVPLVAHVVVGESGQLASLPAEVALVPGHVQRAKEDQPVGDHRELVDIP